MLLTSSLIPIIAKIFSYMNCPLLALSEVLEVCSNHNEANSRNQTDDLHITSELKDNLSYTDESQNTVIWRILWFLD